MSPIDAFFIAIHDLDKIAKAQQEWAAKPWHVKLRMRIRARLLDMLGDNECHHPRCCCVCGHQGKCPECGPSYIDESICD